MKIFTLFFLLLFGVFSIPDFSSSTHTQGWYRSFKHRSKIADKNPVISGYIRGFEPFEKNFFPVPGGFIWTAQKDTSWFTIRKTGFYTFQIPEGKYDFMSRSRGYWRVRTRPIQVNKGDSLVINFYLYPEPPIDD
jgi:hypothetical protein